MREEETGICFRYLQETVYRCSVARMDGRQAQRLEDRPVRIVTLRSRVGKQAKRLLIVAAASNSPADDNDETQNKEAVVESEVRAEPTVVNEEDEEVV